MFSTTIWSINVLLYAPSKLTRSVFEIKFSPILLKALDISLRVCLLPSGRREGAGVFCVCFHGFESGGEDEGEGGGFFSFFTK